MRHFLRAGLVAPAFAMTAPIAAHATEVDHIDLIEAYFEHITAVFEQGSDASDIDALLEITHADVRYIHTRFGAEFDRETWRAAFMRNLDRGAYSAPPGRCVDISNTIPGHSHTAIAYRYGDLDANGACQPEDGPAMLAVFWIEDGLLREVNELW